MGIERNVCYILCDQMKVTMLVGVDAVLRLLVIPRFSVGRSESEMRRASVTLGASSAEFALPPLCQY